MLCASAAVALTMALCTEASLTSACFTLAGKSFHISALTLGTWRLGQLSGHRDLSNLSLSLVSESPWPKPFVDNFRH